MRTLSNYSRGLPLRSPSSRLPAYHVELLYPGHERRKFGKMEALAWGEKWEKMGKNEEIRAQRGYSPKTQSTALLSHFIDLGWRNFYGS